MSFREMKFNLLNIYGLMQEQLKPLTLQLARVEDLPVPDFGTYQSWEASVKATPGEAVRDIVMVDYTKSAQVLEGGGPPCIGETKVCLFQSAIKIQIKGDYQRGSLNAPN